MNLFKLPELLPAEEWVQILTEVPGLRIERIVSSGQVSPDGFYYDQEEDEWVAVLQGEACIQYPLENGKREVRLSAGDFLFLPAHQRHRVSFTSERPPCIWLCVFLEQQNGT